MRANASAPMILEDCEVAPGLQLTDDGAGFKAMLEVVLPLFNLGTSAVALGLCRAAVAGTAAHLKSARFEHLGQTLGESLPTLRAQLATMQIETDGLAARIDDLVDHLERPRETTMLRVLESKAAAGDIAIAVTSAAMRVCGGAAFSKHHGHRAIVPRCPCGRRDGADGRCAARVHRQGHFGNTAVLSESAARLAADAIEHSKSEEQDAIMSRTIWVGAVAYDPKVVGIWEGMRRYFHEEAHLPVEVVLFQSYEAQVAALLASPGEPLPRIDIGWNTNLAFIQADAWSDQRCRPIAMRDTDLGWTTKIVAVTGGPVAKLADLKNRTLALGSRDSGHAAILPVHFLEREGLAEGKRLPNAALQQRRRQARRHRHERGRCRSRGPRWPRRCRRNRQPILECRAQRAPGAGRRAHRDLDLAALSITACSRRGPISTPRWSRRSPRHYSE